jgi:hypothetical protein
MVLRLGQEQDESRLATSMSQEEDGSEMDWEGGPGHYARASSEMDYVNSPYREMNNVLKTLTRERSVRNNNFFL